MKIIIAPDSYKESLTAMEVAEAIEAGFKKIFTDANTSNFRWQTAAKAQCNRSLMPLVLYRYL
ncbi:glycerate kinase [Vibrio maritimus]|uniref:Glycerate kinase n=1 Tax=Vibrio maritimus TaxID=990268 RepID=A0A090T1K1_9VIBR|nr:glycerate kinase [Vibrio maritimus]